MAISATEAGALSRGDQDVAPSNGLPKSTQTQVRQISSVDGSSRTVHPLTVETISQAPTSLATSPKLSDNAESFGIDAYREGGFTGGNDPMLQKYSLSDYEKSEEAASIWVTQGDGTNLVSAYARFFMLAANEVEAEKYQIVETFTNFYAFFYGKRPPVYRYSGILLEDPNFRWTNEFRFMYENYFRGTKAVELNATCSLRYNTRQVHGLILGMSMANQANDPKLANFSIDVLVLDYQFGAFSSDIAGLLRQKQEELVALKTQIQQELAAINANMPTEQKLAANLTLAGRRGASKPKKKTDTAATRAPVNQRVSPNLTE